MSEHQKQQNFQIGQIVYILSNKGQLILPAMIIEESIIQTLDGKKISWKFAIGQEGSDQKICNSEEINGDVYSSLEEIKDVMLKKLNKYVEDLIKKANEYERNWYSQQIKKAKEIGIFKKETKKEKIDPESLISNLDQQNIDVQNNLEDEDKISYIDENGVKINIHGVENI